MAWPPLICDEKRLGVGKNLGPPQRDFHNVFKVASVNGGVFGNFGALIGAPWVMDMRRGLPRYF